MSDHLVRQVLATAGEISLPGLELLLGRNRKDQHDAPKRLRQALRFTWLETVDDATAAALSNLRIRRVIHFGWFEPDWNPAT